MPEDGVAWARLLGQGLAEEGEDRGREARKEQRLLREVGDEADDNDGQEAAEEHVEGFPSRAVTIEEPPVQIRALRFGHDLKPPGGGILCRYPSLFLISPAP